MYVSESRGSTPAAASRSAARGLPRPGRRSAVASTVLALGAVSLITDISSEMVTAVLPLYLVTGLGLSPLGFGLLDGVYNGFSALVRLVGGHLADRGGRHKQVAALGYGLSALCKPLLLAVHTLPLIGAVLAADRTGKGLRTAPRDALISLSSPPQGRGRAFGVHRAMDTTGALLGPLVAFLILRQAADGYDAVFTVSFCVAMVGVLVLLLFVPSRAREAAAPADGAERPSLRAAVALLGRRELRGLALCAVALGLATVSDSFVYLMLQRLLACPTAGSRCCRSAPRQPSCCSPCRSGAGPTGSAAGGSSSAAMSRCCSRTACCSRTCGPACCRTRCSPCTARSTRPPTAC